MIARAAMVLPLPDSPTIPRNSPRPISKQRSSTMGMAPPASSRRFATGRSGVCAISSTCRIGASQRCAFEDPLNGVGKDAQSGALIKYGHSERMLIAGAVLMLVADHDGIAPRQSGSDHRVLLEKGPDAKRNMPVTVGSSPRPGRHITREASPEMISTCDMRNEAVDRADLDAAAAAPGALGEHRAGGVCMREDQQAVRAIGGNIAGVVGALVGLAAAGGRFDKDQPRRTSTPCGRTCRSSRQVRNLAEVDGLPNCVAERQKIRLEGNSRRPSTDLNHRLAWALYSLFSLSLPAGTVPRAATTKRALKPVPAFDLITAKSFSAMPRRSARVRKR